MRERITSDQLLSQEVREFVTHRPHWFIRRGNTIFLIVFLCLLGMAAFIGYPDVIKARMHIVASNAPKLVTSRVEGKIEKIFVKHDQQVKGAQYMAYMQSTAKHEQVLELKQWIDSIEVKISNDQVEALLNYPLPSFNQLGDLQAAYEELNASAHEILQIFSSGYYLQKKASIKADISYLQQVQSTVTQQKQMAQYDYELQRKEYEAKKTLLQEKVIAPIEFNQDESRLLAKQQTVQQVNVQSINNNLNEQAKRKELLELEKLVLDHKQKLYSSLSVLKSQVADWMQQYIITAPEDGTVLFTNFLQENQLIHQGQELFYIQGPNSQFYGELMAGQNGFGRIRAEQPVIIRAEGYPSNEFGILKGKISRIANVPTKQDSFLIKVDLPRGLMTSYDRQLHFRNNLLANAEIITDERPLLYRFLGQLGEIIRK